MSSAFDPAAFEAQTTSDASSTSRIPIPDNEYVAQIGDYAFRQGVSKKTNESFVSMDVMFDIVDDTGQLTELLGRPPRVTMQNFVDVTPSGGFDFSKGKNVWLGKLREALGMNQPGQQFSFPMLKGQVLRIKVITEPSKDNPEDIYNRVKSFGKIG